MMGTYIHWVLLFALALLFRKWITTGLIGTYIHRVLVIDGYLYSRVYSCTVIITGLYMVLIIIMQLPNVIVYGRRKYTYMWLELASCTLRYAYINDLCKVWPDGTYGTHQKTFHTVALNHGNAVRPFKKPWSNGGRTML